MAKQSMLVADADPRSLRILDVALRKAGFAVTALSDGAEALRRIRHTPPDLVLCEVALPGQDGLSLCKAVRADPRIAGLPILLMSGEKDPALRVRVLEAGAEDFLPKPILIKELVGRIRMLLLRREQARFSQRGDQSALTGAVGELGLVDLFQSLEGWKRSAIVLCEWEQRTAQVWVKDGHVIDAELGPLLGEAAFYRLLSWDDGTFRVEFAAVDREPRIDLGTQGLLLETMRRVDETERAFELLPADTVLRVDFNALASRLAELPDEVNGVIRLIDGRRTVAQMLEVSPIDDLSTLAITQRLLNERVLQRGVNGSPPAPKHKPSLRQWLGEASEPPPPRGSPAEEAMLADTAKLQLPLPTPAAEATPPADAEVPVAPPAADEAPAVSAAAQPAAEPAAPPAKSKGRKKKGAEELLPQASADSPTASFEASDVDVALARAFAPPAEQQAAAAEPAPPPPEVAAAALQVQAAFAHADAQQVFEVRREPLPEGLHQVTAQFQLPPPKREPVPMVRFPPLRGVRRERLRQEADDARAALGEGRPVRLTHVVELPVFPETEPAAAREISPAVSEAAKKFAPDLQIGSVRSLARARVHNGVEKPAVAEPAVAAVPAAEPTPLPVPTDKFPSPPAPAEAPAAPAAEPAGEAAPAAATAAPIEPAAAADITLISATATTVPEISAPAPEAVAPAPETPAPLAVPPAAAAVSPAAVAPARKTDEDFEAEIRAALKPRSRTPLYVAGGAVALVAAFFALRPQPATDKQDAPWLDTKPPAAAPASAEAKPAAPAAPGASGPAAAPEPAAKPAAAPESSKPAEPPPQPAATSIVAPPPAEAASSDDYQRSLAAGEALLKRGKYKAAVTEFKKAVQLNPESVPALLALGDAFLEADAPRNAVKPLEKAAKLDARSGRAQLLLGTAYQSLARNPDAMRAYQKYLELEPAGEFARDVRSILANLKP